MTSVLVLMLFVTLALAAAGFLLFLFTVSRRTLNHSDRLALAPLADDEVAPRSLSSTARSDCADPDPARSGCAPP